MQTAETTATQTAEQTVDRVFEVEWDGDEAVEPGDGRRPCRSFDEGRARSVAVSRALASGWQGRWKGWVNTWKAAVNDPLATPLLQEAVEQAAEGDRTSVGRLRQYLNLVASMTSWDAKDPVFSKRETFAELMGCSVSVVSRCAMAAERAGLLTMGVQPRWLAADDDGIERHKSSSAVRMLVLDSALGSLRKAANEAKKRAKQIRAAVQVDRVQREALANKRAAERERAERVDELVDQAPVAREPISPSAVQTAKQALAQARRQLLE